MRLILVHRPEEYRWDIQTSGLNRSVKAMASQHTRRPRESSRPELAIGRYTRLDEIGRGSFATVYQGVHTVSSEFEMMDGSYLD